MAVAEQVGREAELRPDEAPQVNVAGIEETVTDKGYHSGAVLKRMKAYGVRSYIPEKKQKGQRNWAGKAEEQQAVYAKRAAGAGRVRQEFDCGGGASWSSAASRTARERAVCDAAICGDTKTF